MACAKVGGDFSELTSSAWKGRSQLLDIPPLARGDGRQCNVANLLVKPEISCDILQMGSDVIRWPQSPSDCLSYLRADTGRL